MGQTVVRPGGDAAVVRLERGPKGLALTTDCTPRYCQADPKTGGAQAVAESWRNLTAVGARHFYAAEAEDFLRGGPEFGATTLSRFYAIHMLLVPGALVALIVAHLWLVAKLGTTAPPWLKVEPPEELRKAEV